MTKPLKRAIYIRSYLAKHSADNHSSADFHIHFLAKYLRCSGSRKKGFFMSIFKNNKQTKLTTTLIQDLNWMVKRVSVDTLPEYQQNSDTLRFRDNIKLYEFEIEWIKTGFSHHLRELEIQELQ